MTNPTREHLLPCPFCGGTCKTIRGVTRDGAWTYGTFWRVFCTSCQARQLFHRTEVEAISAWNTRVQAKAAPEGEVVGYRARFLKEPDNWMVNWGAKSLPAEPNLHAEYQWLYIYQPSHDAELMELLADQLTWHQARDKELSKSGRNDIDYHWRRLQHQEQITLIDAKLTELRKGEANE